MKRIAAFVCGFMLLMSGVAYSNADYEQKALKAADSWLVLNDAKDFKKSWKATSSLFQEQVTLDQWKKAMNLVGTQIGGVQSRTLLSKTYLQQLPNAPKGDYVVLLYESTLSNGDKAIETITPMKDSDDKWRVSGYFIKPMN